jgi:hypothetical protein
MNAGFTQAGIKQERTTCSLRPQTAMPPMTAPFPGSLNQAGERHPAHGNKAFVGNLRLLFENFGRQLMTTVNFPSWSGIRVNRAVERDQILLHEAEAEELRAQLSLNLCQARVAAAKVRAIRARLAARPR